MIKISLLITELLCLYVKIVLAFQECVVKCKSVLLSVEICIALQFNYEIQLPVCNLWVSSCVMLQAKDLMKDNLKKMSIFWPIAL